MSSMRNTVSRRSHRERAQPLERQRLGLLEKHKDYSLRAKDHKKKDATLKRLREIAADRNEDEFYFGMLSRGKFSSNKLSSGKRWDGTVSADRGNKSLDVDVARFLKTQDMGYLRTMRNVAAKEAADLEHKAIIARAFCGDTAEADLDDEDDVDFDDDDDDDGNDDEAALKRFKPKPQPKPKKIVFAESAEELQAVLPRDREDEEMADDFDKTRGPQMDRAARKRLEKAARLRRRLSIARKKLKTLTDAENELEMQRARMAKTATVGGITKKGKKIKIRERKR